MVKRDGRTFYYSDCGHLVGCDDPDFDLEAEQARIRHEALYTELDRAIDGEHWYSSSTPLDDGTHDALFALAREPSEKNVLAVVAAFNAYEAWLADQ
ncbi:hypothetical protein A5735_01880 [Mycolicibacter heraklionensis]|nr:hypothetical protein A5735_01880 [Mycolicibacter heraklionensis]